MNWNFGNIDFSVYPFYAEKPLGISYSKEQTVMRLWAPTASRVLFRTYNKGWAGELTEVIQMRKEPAGVWVAELEGDCHRLYYTIQCQIDERWMDEIPDPYAFAVGVNGRYGMICDFARTNPDGWDADPRIVPEHYTDMVIYELHVRDFSIDENSGITNKGKYLAFTEKGTCSPNGLKTGVDHLVETGITHVHLLPVYDFFTVDEMHPEKKEYNWGYDPLNYNAPEGSYSTNPYEGDVRIREFKQMVKALHDAGIGVIMDVVYNHTGLIHHSYFNQTVPGYYYRQQPNGDFSDASGCGTEIASERLMVRKYIVDSILFWANEYHIDGFRFDLMGVFDIETMNAIRTELDKIDPKIVMYGEGWTGGECPMPEKLRAVKNNAPRLIRTAFFNDDFRDALKGNWSYPNSLGYASGRTLNEESVKYGIVAATHHPQINYNYVETIKWAWSSSPQQTVNYVSCHDNYTLFDKIKYARPDASTEEIVRMVCLAGAVLLTSQGIPFLHAGIEMLRTKRGNGNSYKSGDEINRIEWKRKEEFPEVSAYFSKLIALRKKHPAFRMTKTEQIQKHLKFAKKYIVGVIAYEISGYANGDSWNHIQVIFNNNPHPVVFPVSKRKWKEIANGTEINENGLTEHTSDTLFVPPISMILLVSEDQ